MITDAQIEAALSAYRVHQERFVLCGRGWIGSNSPMSVVDEDTGETVYGPAPDAVQWVEQSAMRAAIEAALASES